jgi:hypothetical protein
LQQGSSPSPVRHGANLRLGAPKRHMVASPPRAAFAAAVARM